MISEHELPFSDLPNTAKIVAVSNVKSHSYRFGLGLECEWLPLCLSVNTQILGMETTPKIIIGQKERGKD